MRTAGLLVFLLVLVPQGITAQSLGDLARQERERKAKQQKATVEISTDEVAAGKLAISPPLDPARKGDLDYLLQQLSRPKPSVELLSAFIPLKDAAIPKLLPMLDASEPLKRFAPATVLIVLGNTDGLGSVARTLNDTMAAPAAASASTDAKMQSSRVAGYALEATKLGLWRFTEGSSMTPEQTVERLRKGPPLEIVGGLDNGQRIFNRGLRDKQPSVRLAALALIRVASKGKDFGFHPDQEADQNEEAIQQITSFLTTERAQVAASPLGSKQK